MVAKLARSQRSASRDSISDEAARLKVGDLLAGKYRVDRIVGEGGMGIVVEAHHKLLEQRVAVKLLYRDIADAEAQSRLLAEARAAAKLQSDHVARVLDVDVGSDGLPFIVMELLEGADLCQIADARGALPPWLVADYMLQTCEGLAHAHGCGIVHRDLKPSNLYLANRPDGSQIIKILDFGVSKSSDPPGDRRAEQLTGGRTMLGSPPYMSPEQVRSPKKVDLRTDIWSLGICMYELLTNSMPFGGAELQETFAQILEKEPAPLRKLVPAVPEAVERIVMKCLAKDRVDRYSDIAELAAALAPHGSGAWSAYAERVQTTLMRALTEDAITSIDLRVPGASPSSTRIEVPGAPGRRTDSLQPELHGTASTVARRFTVFEKKPWLLAGIAGPAVIGVLLIGFVTFGKGVGSTSTDGEVTGARPDAPLVADPPPPSREAAGVPGEPRPGARPIDGDTSDPNQGTVAPSPTMQDPSSRSQTAARALVAPPPPRAASAAPVAPARVAAPPAKTPPPPQPAASAKPPILPRELLDRE